jgi:hypothetical protein
VMTLEVEKKGGSVTGMLIYLRLDFCNVNWYMPFFMLYVFKKHLNSWAYLISENAMSPMGFNPETFCIVSSDNYDKGDLH